MGAVQEGESGVVQAKYHVLPNSHSAFIGQAATVFTPPPSQNGMCTGLAHDLQLSVYIPMVCSVRLLS